MPRRPSVALWIRSAVLGAVLGTIFLGIGGRIAMRGIALAQGAAGGFSFGGTSTVVFLGTLAGLAAGLIYVACRSFVRRPAWARVLFGAIILAIALRGLKPLDPLRLVLFLPLFLVFGIALDRLWERQEAHPPLQSVGVQET